MSSLITHAQAAEILAGTLADEAAACGDERHALLLARLSKAHLDAGRKMRAQVTAEFEAFAAQQRLMVDYKKRMMGGDDG